MKHTKHTLATKHKPWCWAVDPRSAEHCCLRLLHRSAGLQGLGQGCKRPITALSERHWVLLLPLLLLL